MSNSKIKSPRRPSAFDDALAKPLLSGKASTPNAVRSKAYSFRQLPPQTTKVSQTGGNATAFAFAPPDSTEDVAAHIGDHSLEIQAVLQSGQDLESALARERHTEITGINGSMRQINEIYRDLSSIVDEQQEDIDDMEENAAETHEQAGNGLKHLQKASKLNKASNKLILIFLTVFALIVTGAVLFIVFR